MQRNDGQLDLFATVVAAPRRKTRDPAGSNVTAFPLVRRRRLVERTARELLARKSDLSRGRHWGRLIDRLQAELRHHQVSPEAVADQIAAFTDAVQIELDRQANTRGAA